MPVVVAVAASPSAISRSTQLLQRALEIVASHGAEVEQYRLADFDAGNLLFGRIEGEDVRRFVRSIEYANGIVIATPVYKAAYSAGLKALLDLLPEGGLAGKVTLTLSTGGSPAHTLAVDHALQPVLSILKAKYQVSGVFASERDLVWQQDGSLHLARHTEERLQRAVSDLIDHLQQSPSEASAHHPRAIRLGRISV